MSINSSFSGFKPIFYEKDWLEILQFLRARLFACRHCNIWFFENIHLE